MDHLSKFEKLMMKIKNSQIYQVEKRLKLLHWKRLWIVLDFQEKFESTSEKKSLQQLVDFDHI
jgi:hypothetical protein